MPDLTRAWSTPNLRRAWLWIRTNPDRAYKSYFRELYSAYAVSDDPLIAHLHDRLRRGLYEPSDACKLLLPKPSGIFRPYSLLTIEDQIVYQAMANAIAEKLFPHVRHLYNNEVFGHLYAGSKSLWFYRKWTDGYSAFNKATESAFKRGYVWAASFDLTACYDSIDHNVLRHMLSTIGVERDLREALTRYLSKWTATATRICHQHGIPQGPLGSGLIAETVLRHFDDQRRRRHDVKYFRYVDDIRLMARKESHLRQELVELDRLSKDVGLFPQSSKIDIHEIRNIEDELKSISNPVEVLPRTIASNQAALRKRIDWMFLWICYWLPSIVPIRD
jgi:retron-type reverse transcriptase